MSGLTLTLRAAPEGRVDLSALLPERLTRLSDEQLAALPLACGNRAIPLGELFAVARDSGRDAGTLTIAGANSRLDRIGAGMSGGRIIVAGDAGLHLGREMSGGSIEVHGSVGAAAAAGLRGGDIEIAGDAGDGLGGALPGEMHGMAGGTVVVRGDAGARVADRMRRGVILVEGDLGPYAGSRMIAGTLIGLGAVGDWPGFAMRRGSLILARSPLRLLPTFAAAGSHELGFLRLLARAYAERSRALGDLLSDGSRVRRFAGDLAAHGQGEILVCA